MARCGRILVVDDNPMGRLLNRRHDLPIILNTACASHEDDFCAWSANACVVKSSDTVELVSTIRKLLQRPSMHAASSQAA